MTRIQNIKGETFGKLTAIEYMYTEKGKSSTWLCSCECGKQIPVVLSSLRNKNTQSCGCLRGEMVAKHNKSHTSEYYAWDNIIQRCTNKNNPGYKDYGERGIFVCEEWKSSFEIFLQQMGNKPSKEFSIDRIDNEDGYYKENCRWTDKFAQAKNQRDKLNLTTGIKNISHSKRDNLYYVSIERKSIRYRKAFKKLEDAVCWKKETLDKIHD